MQRRAARGLNPCPPEMRQASLVKNAVSIRRESVRAVLLGEGPKPSKPVASDLEACSIAA